MSMVKCDNCKQEVGYMRSWTYPPDSRLWDKIEYDFEPNEEFGDTIDGEYYCRDCYEEEINKEEEDDGDRS